MFAKSGWAVTGHIDLKPVNSSTLCEGDFLSFVVFRFRLSGALENLFRPQIESFFVNRLNSKVRA